MLLNTWLPFIISKGNFFLVGLYIISLIDCVRDIILSKDYYEDLDIHIDEFFAAKSLLNLVCSISFSFIVRPIFLLIITPYIYFYVSVHIKKKIELGHPLYHRIPNRKIKAYNYYYRKQLNKLKREGKVISNELTILNEARISLNKQINLNRYDDAPPEDNLAKAYLSSAIFAKYPDRISEIMSQKGVVPLREIKFFDELKDLNCTIPIYFNGNRSISWSDYFIIQALDQLVAKGIFEDLDLSDNVYDNHAYRYTQSKVKMLSIDANSDPRFALD